MAEGRGRLAIWAGVAGVAAALVLGAVLRLQAPPMGPQPVAWDEVRCARCGMLVGDPAFAAQLHTVRGEVLHFDDPGCLLLHDAGSVPEAHAVYFHHLRGEGWLQRDEVGFVSVDRSPMDYGLGAVERDTEGAFGYEEALRRLRVRGQGEG